MSTGYIHFTDEQKETARQTDIADLLRRQGETLKRSGSELEWCDGSQKVTVRGNLWSHQYDRQGGDAIDFVRRFYNKTYRHIPFTPERWREQAKNGKTPTAADGKPLPQGIVVGCTGRNARTTAMIDTGDVHALMIGAAGVGKTAYWLYPCIEYACASGMSWLSTDTKGDIMRNYGQIAKDYGYGD